MSKEIIKVDEESLAELKDLYPTETSGFTRIQLPRIAFSSQDVMEGTGKSKKVVIEAGTFSLEIETEKFEQQTEEDKKAGKKPKKIWEKKEIGTSIEAVILYHRYQLSYYDGEKYTSSPVYDDSTDIIPLWRDKQQVAKGTPAELKAMYQYIDEKDNKTKSNLKDNRILYILYKGAIHQLNLHGSSMFSFMTYARKVNPPAVLTRFESEPKVQGKVEWNMMTFVNIRPLGADEIQEVIGKVREIKAAIAMEKGNRAAPVKSENVYEDEDDDDVKFIALAVGNK